MNDEKEIWERLTVVEQSAKSAHHRIDNIERLTESIHTLATELKYMREDVNALENRMTDLEEKPAKRWDLIVTTAITAIVSGSIGFVISILIGG